MTISTFLIIVGAILMAYSLVKMLREERSSTTMRLPDLHQPDGEPLVMLGAYPYHLDIQHARPGFDLPAEYWQRYTDNADMGGLAPGSHRSINLGHDESVRSARNNRLPAGEVAPTTGVGAVEGYFPGHADLPEPMRTKHIAVLENFDKVDSDGKPVRTLIGESAIEIPSSGLAVRNVLVHVNGDTRRCRYTLHSKDGELLADTGWHEVEHSQPLGGPDVARAMWPAWGRVDATACKVTWSASELMPLVPMRLEA